MKRAFIAITGMRRTIIALVIIGLASVCQGASIYVDGDAPGANNGTSWANAYHFLQDALTTAISGDTIRAAEGVYEPDANNAVPSGSGNRAATFQLKNGVVIEGGYAGYGQPDPDNRNISEYETILSGDLNCDDGPNFANNGENSYHVLIGSGTNSTALLDGLTITAGNANGAYPQNRGGGMYNSGGAPTINNCTFSSNSASIFGGGIDEGGPTITSCRFICNQALKYGGALYTCSGPISDCSFVGNYAGQYGGASYDCCGPFTNCRFAGNTAGDYGGGLTTYLQNCLLINCTFTGNSAGVKGGGLYSAFRNIAVQNCTLTGNSAGQTGGGIWVGQASYLTLVNSILWGDSPSEIYSNSGTPPVTYSDVQGGWSGQGNINSDPQFVDADGADNVIGTLDDNPALFAGSACINVGDNNAVPVNIVTDIIGNPRIVNNVVDMGAYEECSTGPVIRIFPNEVEFHANEGGANPDNQILTVWNTGTGTLNWLITYNCEWLTVWPLSGSSSGETDEVTLSANITDLAGGTYSTFLTFTDPCAFNNPQTVKVDIVVTGPVFELSTAEFTFDANEGGPNPAEMTFAVRNTGGGTLNWQITSQCGWLNAEPTNGSSTGDWDIVTISADIAGLENGIYDCNLIITDPNAENGPISIKARLNLAEVWRNYITFPSDPFDSNVIFESDPRWVKFTIKMDDPCTVYFQNSKLYPFHYHFATEWLEPFIGMTVSEYYNVALYDAGQQASLGAVILPPMTGNPPVPEFAEYGIQFIRYDAYTKEEIASMFNAVKNSVIADPCVVAVYFPTYEQQQVATANKTWFESQSIQVDSINRWIPGNICYSKGWAIGLIKYFPGDQIQSAYINGNLLPDDILMTDGVPAEVPYVAGIISLTPSTPNSHVAILSNTYGIPFVYLGNASDIGKAWQLVNKLTMLCVQEASGVCSVQLKDAVANYTPEEIAEMFEMKTPGTLDISPIIPYGSYSADANNLLPEDINQFGGKASNYGMLRTSIPGNSPRAAAISFDLWNAFLDQPLTPTAGTIVDPCGYKLFWADNQPSQGNRHAGFKLSEGGEAIGLFDIDGTTLIDGFDYGQQTADVSYGRTSDGNDNWSFFSGGNITPNAANPGSGSKPQQGLFINEFMADNDSIIADEYSQYDDWFEIYNAGTSAVDMGGMYLTDDLNDPTNWMIPVGITGSTLRQEIANRLSGYTYPVSDLAGLSAQLTAIRNIITNPNITHFTQQQRDAIIAMLQDPSYGFNPNKLIRFRSSTNVEDSDKFSGAGLYDSYSGCLADDLDGDESGPCLCDSNETNERGVFRAIRKVLASFYNENAYLERMRHEVNEPNVGMAMLVHHSFPDEIELANGVATMERKSGQTSWDIKLVTQKGAVSVTNPVDTGLTPEEVSVYVGRSGGMSMTLLHQSNLVILGETVMQWQDDYNDIIGLLVTAAERFEQVTGKTDYILDFEYKKVAPGGAALPAGGIDVDQIRQIPRIDTDQTACPSFSYTCASPPYSNSYLVEQSYEDSNVSLETSYYLYCTDDICFNSDFYAFCRTTIRGYTTRPIVMFTGYAEPTYWGMNHVIWADFYFTPSLEPGIDQCLLNQLRAKDIRVIHLDLQSTPAVEITGFGSGPYYLGDFEPDGDVDMKDFAGFAQRWLNIDCGLCGGKDLDCDAHVDMEDFKLLAQNWLEGF